MRAFACLLPCRFLLHTSVHGCDRLPPSTMDNSHSRARDFDILEVLGKGSYGVVHRVKRKADGRSYVLKRIALSGLSRREQQDAINEVRLLAVVSSPHVTRYYDSFIEDSQLHIIMELAENGTLHHRLKSRKGSPLPEPVVWSFFLQIAIGLFHLHE